MHHPFDAAGYSYVEEDKKEKESQVDHFQDARVGSLPFPHDGKLWNHGTDETKESP